MEPADIYVMRHYETGYWWHVSRREILQSVLNRFLGRHPEHSLRHPEHSLRHPEHCPSVILNSPFCHPELVSGSLSNSDKMLKLIQHDDKKPGMTMMKILDVGCGTGENFKWLQNFGEVTGVDTSELGIKLASQKGTATLGRAEDLPVENQEFDLVTAFDVLEHLSDEERALEEWGRILRPGGYLFLSVPAHQWLFGPHDKELSHYRRYSSGQLTKLLQNNGFTSIFVSYFFCLTFPLFLLQRLVASITQKAPGYTPVPKLINSFLVGLGKMEANWLKFSKFPFGSSIIIIARKR